MCSIGFHVHEFVSLVHSELTVVMEQHDGIFLFVGRMHLSMLVENWIWKADESTMMMGKLHLDRISTVARKIFRTSFWTREEIIDHTFRMRRLREVMCSSIRLDFDCLT